MHSVYRSSLVHLILTYSISLASIYSLSLSHPSPTSEISTLSLHDALPILVLVGEEHMTGHLARKDGPDLAHARFDEDRKSTRLNSSHRCISYAVFCLKKKKTENDIDSRHNEDAD